jgi:hypothetical protein
MYSPVGAVGDLSDRDAGEPNANPTLVPSPTNVAVSGPGQTEAVASLSVLTEGPPTSAVADRMVRVPGLTTVAIGLSVGFTIVFGIIPGPIVDFAHQATLLFT